MITHSQVSQHSKQTQLVKEIASQEVNTITLNREGKPSLFIYIAEKPVQALVDTGSGITVISEKLAKKCTAYPIEPTSVKAHSITGEKLPFLGEITLPFAIGSTDTFQTAQVLSQLPQDCLLGMNFIDKLGPLSLKTIELQDPFARYPIANVPEEVVSITLPT
jgi:predicted aspartyl protease